MALTPIAWPLLRPVDGFWKEGLGVHSVWVSHPQSPGGYLGAGERDQGRVLRARMRLCKRLRRRAWAAETMGTVTHANSAEVAKPGRMEPMR